MGEVRIVRALAVAACLLAASCSGTKKPAASAEFEAGDPVMLIEAAERTAALPYRYHSTLSIEGGDGGALEDLGELVDMAGMAKLLDIRGTVVGDDRAIRVKTSLVAGYLDALSVDIPLDPIGLQTEARRIDGVWYVRAPRTLIIAALQEVGEALPVEDETYDKILSGWVRIDPGDQSSDMEAFSRTALLGSESLQRVLDPVDILAQLTEVEEVEVAPGVFDEAEVTVVRSTIRFDGDGAPIQVEAAVGDDGLLKSVSFGITLEDMVGLVASPIEPQTESTMAQGNASGGTTTPGRASGAADPSGPSANSVDPFVSLRQVIRTNFHFVGSEGVLVEEPEVYSVLELQD